MDAVQELIEICKAESNHALLPFDFAQDDMENSSLKGENDAEN